jgi:hypothetical protein
MIEILNKITADSEYVENIKWGKPRKGHIEGTIENHIDELLKNLQYLVDKFPTEFSEKDILKLKILIHTHDTFKGKSKRGVSIIDKNSHSSIARRFLSKFTNDCDLLNMIQYHDEIYAIFKSLRSGERIIYNVRFTNLINRIKDFRLFSIFFIIDSCTKGKDISSVCWFLDTVLYTDIKNLINVGNVNEEWIIKK